MRLCYIHTYMGHRRACGIVPMPHALRCPMYVRYFKSHKHEMNEDTEKREVDENIINLQKKVCMLPTWKRNFNMSSSS